MTTMPAAYWRNLPTLKKALIIKHGKVCQRCGRKPDNRKELVVHHLNYRNIGREKLDQDVTLLCHSCHKQVHSK